KTDDEPCISVDEPIRKCSHLAHDGHRHSVKDGLVHNREDGNVFKIGGDRSPGFKLFLTIVVGTVLAIPLVSVYLLTYHLQPQSREAARSITAGWGGAQTMNSPVLVIPYKAATNETVVQNGQSVTRTNEVTRELTLAPEAVELSTAVVPKVKKRSIYEAVLFD